MITDFHTHAFPDGIAADAVRMLASKSNLAPSNDGTVKGLLESMDRAGIEKSVVLNIATKPSQTENIIKWCLKIRSVRIEPFPSIHPDNGNYRELLKKIKTEGLKGIKFHPMYQDFAADEEKMFPVYEEAAKAGLVMLFHSGYDISFPVDGRASVRRIKKISDKFPDAKIVASHTGGWKMWDEVEKELAGSGIYIETSMTLLYIKDETLFGRIIKKHCPEKLLFGTDAPWGNQSAEVKNIKKTITDEVLRRKIFAGNAEYLLAA